MAVIGFMQIPAEVRNQIYGILFEGAVIEDHGRCFQPVRTKNYHLAITVTNRQIRAESLPLLQQATKFHFLIGPAGATPVPAHVLREIRTVRLPKYRLGVIETVDTSVFINMETLTLDYTLENYVVERVHQRIRSGPKANRSDIRDMIEFCMTIGESPRCRIFQEFDKIWGDEGRRFRILCWFNACVGGRWLSILVDLDSGAVLQDSGFQPAQAVRSVDRAILSS